MERYTVQGVFAKNVMSIDCVVACHTAKILYEKLESFIPRKRNCVATVPIPTLMFLCAIYIFP
jgi:hypothetical protein